MGLVVVTSVTVHIARVAIGAEDVAVVVLAQLCLVAGTFEDLSSRVRVETRSTTCRRALTPSFLLVPLSYVKFATWLGSPNAMTATTASFSFCVCNR